MTTPNRHPKRRPLGITLLSIFEFLVGLQTLGIALAFFAWSSLAKTAEGLETLTNILGSDLANAASGIFLLLGLVYFPLAIWKLLLSRGYFKGYEKSRRAGRSAAVLAVLFAIIGTSFLPEKLAPGSPLWTIIFNIGIFAYLGRPKVKAYFAG